MGPQMNVQFQMHPQMNLPGMPPPPPGLRTRLSLRLNMCND
jgi:hypothetical protein